MVYSQSLLARRGPLGAVWVAAYCFKKLKKTQITDTDILASIDKILQDEWDGVTYRVLAYLLLGVVRIYSRKVECLFDDCNKVLIDIKKFVVSTNDNAPTEVVCASVTIPDTFELDAFDMGSLEDVSSAHLVSHKEITLIECADWNGIGRLSSEMYDHVEFGACHSIFSTYYSPVRSVLSSHLMDFHMELRTSRNDESEEIVKQLQWHRFSQEECANRNTFLGIEKEPQNQFKQCGEHNETNGEMIKTPDIVVVPEDEIQEEVQNHEILGGNDREPSCHVITGEDHQSDREEMMELDLVQPENLSFKITEEEHSLRNLKAQEKSMDLDVLCGAKKPQELVCSYGEENLNAEPAKVLDMMAPDTMKNIPEEDPESFSVEYDGAKKPQELVCSYGEENLNAEPAKVLDMMAPDTMKNIPEEDPESFSVEYDGAKKPQELVCSHGEENHNAEPAEVLDMMAPDTMKNIPEEDPESFSVEYDGAKKPQELVCSYGEENLNAEPAKVLDMMAPDTMKNIPEEDPESFSVEYDGSDAKQPDALGVTTPKLVAVPRPASKRSAQISRKRKCVFDDIVMLPSEVVRQSVHDASDLVAKRRKVPKNAHAVWQTCQIRNLAQNFLEPLISNVSQELRSLLCKRKLRKLKITPEKLDLLNCQRTGISEQIEVVEMGTVEPIEDSDVLDYPCAVTLEQAEIAPDTPVLRPKSIKSFHSPKSPEVPDIDLVRPETSGRLEKEPSMGAEQEIPSGNVEEIPSLDRDQEHDFNLLTEEAEICEGVSPEPDGCSVRTRKVARYLHRHFTIYKSRGEKEVNLLEVAERRTKKESARLFYETLVLKTRGFVDVKQADPYGDILIWKLPKWEQMWGDNTVNKGSTSETMLLCP